MPYLKDGCYSLLVFNQSKVLDDIDLSQKMQLGLYIKPNDNLPFPMMDACFYDIKNLEDDLSMHSATERRKKEKLFVTMFLGKDNKLMSLTYCYFSQQIISKIQSTNLEVKNGG